MTIIHLDREETLAADNHPYCVAMVRRFRPDRQTGVCSKTVIE